MQCRIEFGQLRYGQRFHGPQGPCVKIVPLHCRLHGSLVTLANFLDLTTWRGSCLLDGDLVRPVGTVNHRPRA